MRSRYRVHEPDRAHFVTSTIVAWLPVFTSPVCCQILVDAFAYAREHKGLLIHGWVASPEHWRSFSAHEWLPGATPLLRCNHWR
jgi:hypothetical protein